MDSFQLSYEELKPPDEYPAVGRRVGFQLSYEELKLWKAPRLRKRLSVFSFPMRN